MEIPPQQDRLKRLLELIEACGCLDGVASAQILIRLLIPAGSLFEFWVGLRDLAQHVRQAVALEVLEG